MELPTFATDGDVLLIIPAILAGSRDIASDGGDGAAVTALFIGPAPGRTVGCVIEGPLQEHCGDRDVIVSQR